MSSISVRPPSTTELLLRIWRQLNRKRQIQLGGLMLIMLLSGCTELVSLGAVVPFLAVLSAPEQLWQQPLINSLALQIGFSGPRDLLIPSTVAFAVAALLAALVRLVNLWLNGRLAAAIGSDLSGEAYRRTLYQPYGMHVQRNSNTVINTITSQVGRTVAALNSTLLFTTSMVVAVSLLIGLLLIDWKVALTAIALFGVTYFFIGNISRRKLIRNGVVISQSMADVLKAVQEGLGAIRDVLLEGSQPLYQEIYLKADRRLRQYAAKNDFLTAFPRFALEAIGMVSIALLGWLLVQQQGSGVSVIPLLGALALGAQRLLPALQQAYNGWASLKGFHADLAGVLAIMESPIPFIPRSSAPVTFNNSLHLQGVDFRYLPSSNQVLQGLDLKIFKGERIGLIGSTGSGKSTTVDLLMGLLDPIDGKLLVDGRDLHDPNHPELLAGWRASIAHVPQSIYLADSSIAENIAFGVASSEIDLNRVREAAQQAQIASFIESRDGGYLSYVGERGIKLSGGQRQRLGIARALYRKPKLLVLDEATSALDNETEAAVMDAINNLSKDLTVILVAHRLSTLKSCDRIVKISNGKVVETSSSAEFFSSNNR